MLSGQYARYFVRGMERNPDAPGQIQASACCKHYVANELENWQDPNGTKFSRHNFDAKVTQQDLADSYLPPFQACVEEGEVSGLMCSCESTQASMSMRTNTAHSLTAPSAPLGRCCVRSVE